MVEAPLLFQRLGSPLKTTMLIIRPEQFAELKERTFNMFERRTIEHIRRDFGLYSEALTDEQLALRIESTGPAASAFGLSSPRELTCFIGVGLMLNNETFFDQPEYEDLLSVLKLESMSAADRAEQVLTLAHRHLPAPLAEPGR